MTARAKVKERHPQAWCQRHSPIGWPMVYFILSAPSSMREIIGVGLTEREAWENASRRMR